MSTLFEKQDTYKNNSLCSFFRKIGGEWVKQSAVKATVKATDKPYLTFSSAKPFSMGVQNAQKNWDGTLYYSTDTETWSEWDGTTSIESEYAGSGHLYPHRLYMRGVGNSVITGELWRGFVFTDNAICCDGNIESLLDCDMVAKGEHPRMSDFCFAGLFHSTGLITPPHLPSTDLSRYCYYCMFYSTGLVVLPTLPATTLQEGCYVSMFAYCSYIKMSTTLGGGYSEPYRIPPFGTADSNPNNNRTSGMFYNTGGTFKGTPAINTTYYTLNSIR